MRRAICTQAPGRSQLQGATLSQAVLSSQARHVIDTAVRKMVSLMASSDAEAKWLLSDRAELRAYDCFQAAVTHFRTHCFNWHSVMVRSPLRGACPLRSQEACCLIEGPIQAQEPEAPPGASDGHGGGEGWG